MLQIDMKAQMRATFGKGAARALRRAGRTPAVLYGPDAEPLALELETRPFTKALLSIHRQNAVINLDVEEGKKTTRRHVVTREVQTDPVQDGVIHADFYEISLDRPMTFEVPLHYKGKAKGVDMGGELEVSLTRVTLKGKALDIPDFLEMDVTSLGLGERMTCGDISVPDHVVLEEKPETVCVSVSSGAVADEA